jgi:hypothetical protein
VRLTSIASPALEYLHDAHDVASAQSAPAWQWFAYLCVAALTKALTDIALAMREHTRLVRR